MKKEVSIAISARHVHLTKEVYEKLFDKDLTFRNKLNQIGQYASNEVVSLNTEKNQIDNVRILGPLRNYNQVEISASDARKLGIKPPVRRSGDIANAEMITISTSKGKVTLPACIIAERHVHMTPKMAEEFGLKDKDIIKLKIDGIKSGTIDINVKVSNNAYFEVHLDTDDANAFLLDNNSKGTLII